LSNLTLGFFLDPSSSGNLGGSESIIAYMQKNHHKKKHVHW
jgi:hypothetical protein